MKFLVPLFVLALVAIIATFSLSQPTGGGGGLVPAETLPTSCSNNQILKANSSGQLVCAADATGGGGTPNVLDLGDDASDESTDLIEIATTGDTNSIFTHDVPTEKLLIAVGNNWPTADAADALSANGANCSAGEFAAGVDASGVAEGCTDLLTETELDTEAELESQLGDVTNVFTNNDGALADDDLSDNNITDLSDVSITTPVNGHIIVYDGVTDNRFENVAMSGDVTINGTGVTAVANDSHTHVAANISDADAGTDITADLEEETHASEHAENAADEILGEALGTACTDGEGLIASSGGLGCSRFTVSATNADCEASGSSVLGELCIHSGDGSLWMGDGTDSNKIGPGTSQTLQQAFDAGKTMSGANSLANGVVITDDGTNSMTLYVSSGQPTIETDCGGSPCDWIVSRNSGTDTITIDNSSNVTLAAGLKEAFSEIIIAKDFDVDGTQCNAPAATTINSVPMTTITCADSDSGALYFAMQSPARWDAGTFNVEVTVISVNATPSGDYDIDWSMQCVGTGEVLDNSWGTEVATDVDFDASGSCGGSACDQYDPAMVTTASAITPSGTCAKGDFLMLRGAIDATGTTATVADVHILGARLIWTADDWSD